jgi:hypothetical protein
MVLAAGGHVAVESAPGAGTTFRVFLKRVARAGEQEKDTKHKVYVGRGNM